MEYIINNYGTHVLTNITLGARLDIMYRSLVASSMKKGQLSQAALIMLKGFLG
ncbi:MACPF domain-containing protein [Bacteroides thetaiotaomicron]|nr:MACPF domain-containing protein [Bacteroides thetaiotaomicron]